MQEVKIIDIDNVQWNMKDQEARNKIANLETANEVKQLNVTKQNVTIIGDKQNKVVVLSISFKPNSLISSRKYSVEDIVPQGWRPKEVSRTVFINNDTDEPEGQVTVGNKGEISFWNPKSSYTSGSLYVAQVSYIIL